MTHTDFLNGLKETLDLTADITLDTQLDIDSLGIMSIIAFVDENFGKRFKGVDIKSINTPMDLIKLIGEGSVEF